MPKNLSVLHVTHDFLPRHRAGSEIYAFRLARRLAESHHVHVLCAEYDPGQRHGSLRWRWYEGLPVVELVNNWRCSSFEETYASPVITRQLERVLEAIEPDILHVHNLLNLSMDLPAVAQARGIPSVATLHDFTLVCPSGGQRVHVAERHVCHVIEPDRCARCFAQSPFHAQIAPGPRRDGVGLQQRIAGVLRRWLPAAATAAARVRSAGRQRAVAATDVARRLAHARRVFDTIDLFVAPSAALAREFQRLGVAREKLHVSDYGFPALAVRRVPRSGRLRIGFVGTLVWHKGVHVLLEAVRTLPPDRFEVKIHGSLDTFPGYVADLRELARGLPVRFLGAFDDARVAEIYADLDVLVVPSLWPENSPLVIHEAFQAGVPVVGARQGGIPELLGDGRHGLLYDAFSPAALGAALGSLLDDPGRLDRLASGVPEMKTIDEDAREWEAMYRRILTRSRPGEAR